MAIGPFKYFWFSYYETAVLLLCFGAWRLLIVMVTKEIKCYFCLTEKNMILLLYMF